MHHILQLYNVKLLPNYFQIRTGIHNDICLYLKNV